MDKPTNTDSLEQTRPAGDPWAAFASRPEQGQDAQADSHAAGAPQEAEQGSPAEKAAQAQTATIKPEAAQNLQEQLRLAQEQLLQASKRLQELESAARAAGLDTPQASVQPEAQAPGKEEFSLEQTTDRDEAAHNATPLFASDVPERDTYVAPGEEEGAAKKPEPTGHNGIFRTLASMGPVTLLVLLALFAWAAAYLGDMACPAEVKNLGVLKGMDGFDLLPHTADKTLLPVYAYFAWGIGQLPLPFMDTLYGPLVSYLGAFVALAGLGILSLGLRLDKYVTLAAGLVLVSLPIFMGVANFIGPVAFSCGLSLAAMGVLCRAWMHNFDMVGMLLGSLLAGAAALSGGLYYGLVPVVAGLVFALWRGNMLRLRNTDAVAGVVLFVVVLLAWYAGILLGTNADSASVTSALVGTQGLAGLGSSVLMALACFMPFLVIVLSVAWPKVLAHSVSSLKASRQESGTAYAWIALALSLLLLAVAANRADFLLAVCLMSVLCARSLMKLGHLGIRVFFLLFSICLLLVTLACLSLTVPLVGDIFLPMVAGLGITVPEVLKPVLAQLSGMGVVATIVLPLLPLLAALVILHVAWRSRTAAAPLLTTAVAIAVIAQPFALVLAPLAANPTLQLVKTASVYSPAPKIFGLPETAAPAKTEAPKAVKPEAAKPAAPETVKSEAAKPAAPKAVKPEAAKPAAAPEAAKSEAPEAVKPEAAKPAAPEAVKPEAAEPEAPEAVKPEAAKPEAAEATKPEAAEPASEAAKPEAAKSEAPEAVKPAAEPAKEAAATQDKADASPEAEAPKAK